MRQNGQIGTLNNRGIRDAGNGPTEDFVLRNRPGRRKRQPRFAARNSQNCGSNGGNNGLAGCCPHVDIARGNHTSHHDFCGGRRRRACQINAFPQSGVVIVLLGQIKSDCVVAVLHGRCRGCAGEAVVTTGKSMSTDDLDRVAGGKRHWSTVTCERH